MKGVTKMYKFACIFYLIVFVFFFFFGNGGWRVGR